MTATSVLLMQNFSSVVGPNGSGKSNVIDAMLFVFGKRAKQVGRRPAAGMPRHARQHASTAHRPTGHLLSDRQAPQSLTVPDSADILTFASRRRADSVDATQSGVQWREPQ